jgi:hypothetical protein
MHRSEYSFYAELNLGFGRVRLPFGEGKNKKEGGKQRWLHRFSI